MMLVSKTVIDILSYLEHVIINGFDYVFLVMKQVERWSQLQRSWGAREQRWGARSRDGRNEANVE
jgi:hypothetical protein